MRWISAAVLLACATFATAASCSLDRSDEPTRAPAPTNTPAPRLPDNPDNLERWREGDLPVSFCIDTAVGGYASDREFEDLVVRALDAWGVPYELASCPGALAEDDGENEIGWGTSGSPGRHGDGAFQAGITNTMITGCGTDECGPDDTPEIVEADIRILPDPPREFRTRACLLSVLLHEIGHAYGIGHLDAPSVMQTRTSECPVTLTRADRAEMEARYGDLLFR